MKTIEFDEPHRHKHFAFFSRMDQPHFGITAEVDITGFVALVRRSPTLRFTPALVYLITRTALELPPFCWRIRGTTVVEHATLRPSFTVPTAESAVFSFCTVPYADDPAEFHQRAVEQMALRATTPSLDDDPGTDDYLFLSAFPWASFTSVTHAMHYSPGDSVPRITWGKYFERAGRVMMPLGVHAHHALVDGSDLGRYYQKIQQHLDDCEKIFAIFA